MKLVLSAPTASAPTHPRTRRARRHATPVLAAALLVPGALSVAQAQTGAAPPAPPPKAQVWIDLATHQGLGMGLGGMGGAGGIGGALGGLFGGGAGGKNEFGRTQQGGTGGRWMDVTLQVRAEPALGEAQQAVPAGLLPSPLQLRAPAPEVQRPVPEDDERSIEPSYERPRGKLLMYWGCGTEIRSGQPRVLDFATMNPAELGRFFITRSALRRGAHQQAGRPVWPNPTDSRLLPAQASAAGEHRFTGRGVPEGFAFTLPAAHDLMPPLQLQQQDAAGATELRWTAAPTAKAYFASAMGGAGENEVVIWTSSELPETGFGLHQYQAPASVDQWLREKVLLSPATTQCAIPRGVFPAGGGGLVRLTAYGPQLNLVHPPRPADRNVRWEPQWAVQVRTQSSDGAMLGMASMGRDVRGGEAAAAPAGGEAAPAAPRLPGAVDILRGILGR